MALLSRLALTDTVEAFERAWPDRLRDARFLRESLLCGGSTMPVVNKPPVSQHGRPDLVGQLTAELQTPHARGTKDAPLVIQEQQRFTDRLHVYVVWEAWADVPATARGEIIVDAYEQAKGRDVVATISLAMGLTREEASNLGIA